MMDMEYNRTSPFISNCLHYSSEFHPYVGEFCYFCPSRTVRGQESNQYNDEKNPIPDGCNGHDVGV